MEVPAKVRDASDRAAARSETGEAERMVRSNRGVVWRMKLIDSVGVGLVSRLD